VSIPIDRDTHPGDLTLPEQPRGVVIFAHGSGSSRLSVRNRAVAQRLNEHGFATLLFDLLTPLEDQDYEQRFDIDLLARRLQQATLWALQQPVLQNLPVGFFGASTGAAAALRAAARMGKAIAAVVSRGGRPDLADRDLPNVCAPTLLVVGGDDDAVIELNRLALKNLVCPKALRLVPGAGHLFEESGALSKVAEFAGAWFKEHLVVAAPAAV
jgi:dienelactone hydrolase